MYQQCTLDKAQCITMTTFEITPCYSNCKVWYMLTYFQNVRLIYGLYESDSRAVDTKFSTDILNE